MLGAGRGGDVAISRSDKQPLHWTRPVDVLHSHMEQLGSTARLIYIAEAHQSAVSVSHGARKASGTLRAIAGRHYHVPRYEVHRAWRCTGIPGQKALKEDEPQLLGGVAARISAQARATSESASLLPGMVANPLFSIRLLRSQVLVFRRASAFTIASGCERKRSTQIGARAATTAVCEAATLSLAAVPPVTHPPQLKPMMASAMAPTTAPWIQGLVCVGIFMGVPFAADERPSPALGPACAKARSRRSTGSGKKREPDRRREPSRTVEAPDQYPVSCRGRRSCIGASHCHLGATQRATTTRNIHRVSSRQAN